MARSAYGRPVAGGPLALLTLRVPAWWLVAVATVACFACWLVSVLGGSSAPAHVPQARVVEAGPQYVPPGLPAIDCDARHFQKGQQTSVDKQPDAPSREAKRACLRTAFAQGTAVRARSCSRARSARRAKP